jgi:hypothetical protein
MSNSSDNGGGLGLAGVLTVVFVVLKLTGLIAWSWWWVLAPLWITISAGLLVLLIVGIAMAVRR